MTDPLAELGARDLPAAALDALADDLVERASRDELLDVAYRVVETRVGSLLAAATPRGLVSVTFDGEAPEPTLQRLADVLGPRVLRAPRALDGVARGLEALASGAVRGYDGPIDLALAAGFRGRVVRALREIPFGETRSYGEVASAVGSPAAVRAVGTACARTPLPLVLPCHRVVRSDGELGRYAGGDDAKRALLAMEGALDAAGRRPRSR